MSKLSNLLKNEFYNITSFNKLRRPASSKERMKGIVFGILILYSLFSLTAAISTYYLFIADSLEKVGALSLLPIFSVIFSSAMIFVTTIYSAQGMLFSFRDFDLLLSMPIQEKTILTAKFMVFYLLHSLFSIFAIVPAAIIYYIRTTPSPYFFLITFLVVLAVPLLPITLSSVFGLLISFISSKFKHKNVITSAISLFLFLLLFAVSFFGSGFMMQLLGKAKSIGEMLGSIYPVGRYLCEAMTELNILSLIWGLMFSILPFALFIVLFAKSYKRINLKLTETFQRGIYRITELKKSSPLKALMIKEVKYYFSTPIYVLNTIVGSVLMIFMSFGFVFAGSNQIMKLLKLPEVVSQLPMMLIAIFSAMVALSCTTCSAISLEGPYFWIIRSLPVSNNNVFYAKIALNLLITIPFVAINSIVLYFNLGLSGSQLVYLILIPVLYAFLSSQIGLLINLFAPKMSWTSPTAVVKQSASVLLSLIVNAATIAVPVLIYINLKPSDDYFLFFSSAGLIAANVIGNLILKTYGARLYQKIET